MSRKQKPALSDLENKVMGVVWEHGRVTADLVRTELEGSQPMKDSTVRTILRRLEEKGYAWSHDRGSNVPLLTHGGVAERCR